MLQDYQFDADYYCLENIRISTNSLEMLDLSCCEIDLGCLELIKMNKNVKILKLYGHWANEDVVYGMISLAATLPNLKELRFRTIYSQSTNFAFTRGMQIIG